MTSVSRTHCPSTWKSPCSLRSLAKPGWSDGVGRRFLGRHHMTPARHLSRSLDLPPFQGCWAGGLGGPEASMERNPGSEPGLLPGLLCPPQHKPLLLMDESLGRRNEGISPGAEIPASAPGYCDFPASWFTFLSLSFLIFQMGCKLRLSSC